MTSDERYPCTDGNCIGTVENGVCRVCGLHCEETAPASVEREPVEDLPVQAEADPDLVDDQESGDWDERQPCPDGNCTGTVEGGACRVCGAAA